MEVTPAGILMFRSEVQRLKAASPIEVMPVSYTHLDVYKRQIQRKPAAIFSSIRESIVSKSPIQISPFIGIPAFPCEKSVSYNCLLYTSLLAFVLLCRLMKRRLQGYTGDCCGAAFLLCELAFYIGSLVLVYVYACLLYTSSP